MRRPLTRARPRDERPGPSEDPRRERGDVGALSRPVRLTPIDVILLAVVGVRSRRLRSVLSALGISLGIATMIVVTGIPASGHKALMRELSALGTTMLQAVPLPDQNPPVRLPEESVDMAGRIGPVTVASAVANTNTVIRRSDRADTDDYLGITVLAARHDLLEAVHGDLRHGRFLGPASDRLPTVVLGSTAASRLGVPRLGPGLGTPMVTINGTWFTVVGILDPVPLAPDLDRAALVGWETARDRLRFDGHPTVIYVNAREEALEDVRAVLPATVNPALPQAVRVSRPSDALAAKRASEDNASALFLGLAGVALLVGGVGVANTMFISVLERRREIGLRRALGASRGQIRNQFLVEAVALSAVGGVAGSLLGVLVVVGYALAQGWPPAVPPGAVLGGCGGAVLVGIAAGVYPSITASRLTPSEALSTL